MKEDFDFRFKLENLDSDDENDSEALISFIKNNIISILNLVELRNDGKIVAINEFNFLNDDSQIYKLY